MKVVHITPTYFDNGSIVGGGERYPTALATWMSEFVDTTLVSFSSHRRSYQQKSLNIEIYPVKHLIHGNKINPLCFSYLKSILYADIVHIHNANTMVSDLGCLISYLFHKRAFVTDHGGGGSLVLNQKIPIFKCYSRAIAQSQFASKFIPKQLQNKTVLIKGGIDVNNFCPDPAIKKEKKILYVGRILPHKGINYLLEAFRLVNHSDYKLMILGKVYSEKYYQDLKQLAAGLNVKFIHDANDSQLLQEYRTSMVTVLPSVHNTCYGDYTSVPELMGFTLLESQACGTPVICTDAGAMHEFVDDERTGFVVKQNSGEAIATAIRKLIDISSPTYAKYQDRCRQWIEPLSWNRVVQRHLDVYNV